jgi:hypothetical protein
MDAACPHELWHLQGGSARSEIPADNLAIGGQFLAHSGGRSKFRNSVVKRTFSPPGVMRRNALLVIPAEEGRQRVLLIGMLVVGHIFAEIGITFCVSQGGSPQWEVSMACHGSSS